MTAAAHHDSVRARAVDRLCELASIGAGHAAGALATLLAKPFVMGVPEARAVDPQAPEAPLAAQLGGPESAWSGVFFDVSGGPGGTLALFVAPPARNMLIAALLGELAREPAHAESALCEVGNIVASHALSAIGDLLHTLVLPSPPQYHALEATRAFAHLLRARASAASLLRIEIELSDRAGELRALLVWAPSEVG
jgi:chemotaxis protein CheY-P-specific phosphatase CheC